MPDVSASYGEFLGFKALFEEFSFKIDEYIHQTFIDCVYIILTFWNVHMPNVTASYGRFIDLIAFFIITCLKRYIFIKLSQIVFLFIKPY